MILAIHRPASAPAVPHFVSATVERQNENRRIYRHDNGARVFVPMQQASDFAMLASVVINEIAAAEQRTQDDVLVDMVWMKFDKVHVRRESEASSLLYTAGIEMHEALGELIDAGARVSSEPRSAYVGGRRPKLVDDYLDQVRMIPSMAGSFVVRALLPLTWGTENPTFDMVGPAHPTVRSVSTTILRATNAAVTTATQIAGDQADMSQWADAVGLGVSSNLCDALLLGLVGEGPDGQQAEVRISWTWAMPAEPIPAVEIPPGIGPILAAGADYLRGEPDEHTVRITGRITNLHRETQQGAGDVTVKVSSRDMRAATVPFAANSTALHTAQRSPPTTRAAPLSSLPSSSVPREG